MGFPFESSTLDGLVEYDTFEVAAPRMPDKMFQRLLRIQLEVHVL